MNIAITGLNATDNPGPGIPTARCIRETHPTELKLIGLSYDVLEPGIYMEGIFDVIYLIPYPSSGSKNLLTRIKEINKKDKIDIIIPVLDSEILGFQKIEKELINLEIKMFIPTPEQLNIRSKDKIFNFCKKEKIKTPKSFVVNSVEEIRNIATQIKFPFVVKGVFYEAFTANNFAEAETFFYKISYKWGLPIIVQEFLSGTEFNVSALGDGKGETIGAVAMKKLYITDKGKGWSGVSINEKNIISIAKKIIKKTKWRGGMELEFIKSSNDRKFYLLEINPRFPAWIYLTAKVGQNLPAELLKIINKQKVKPLSKYETGKIFIRASLDYFTNIKELGKITLYGEKRNK